jgi:hypothetical protein
MTVVRQQAFNVNQGVRDKDIRGRDERTQGGGRAEEGSRADVAAHLRPLRDTTTNPDGRGSNNGGSGGGRSNESVADQLAYQIGNLSNSGINRAVRNLEGIRRQNAIPTDSPLATVGPNARAATFHRGTLLRERFAHAPWRGGRDGSNLSTSGKPFAFQSPGFSAGRPFDARSSDIPQEWVAQNLAPEMHNARANSDKPYMRNLLAAGRYSHIRV